MIWDVKNALIWKGKENADTQYKIFLKIIASISAKCKHFYSKLKKKIYIYIYIW